MRVTKMESPEASSISTYQYSALPDSSDYIRLFEVQDAVDESDEINCNLSIWAFDKSPSYHAISYTWGDRFLVEEIRLNGAKKAVAKSCADVMRQLRHFRTSRYYWLDAICIDQDDLAEKSHQVANMGNVFERAAQVMACLGTDDEECEYAMHMMAAIEQHFLHSSMKPTQKTTVGNDIWSERKLDALLARVPGMDVLRFVLGVLKIAQRPYFNRVWILQELLLAGQVCFCFGWHLQPTAILIWHLDHTAGYCGRIQNWARQFRSGDPAEYPQSLVDAVNEWYTPYIMHQTTYLMSLLERGGLATTPRKNYGRHRMSPTELIDLCNQRLCQDPRDTIYGTLALTDWHDHRPIIPDYTKTKFDLAVEYAQCLTNYHEVHKLLSNLKMDRDTASVQAAIRRRKHVVLETNWNEAQIQSSSKLSRIETPFFGRQIGQYFSKLRAYSFADQECLVMTDAIEPQSDNIVACFPRNTEPQDFIVWSSPGMEAEALVLRSLPQGDAGSVGLAGLGIVGRAWMFRNSPLFSASFRIYFDPEDFILYSMIAEYVSKERRSTGKVYLGERDLQHLSLSVCKQPFSSVAYQMPEGSLRGNPHFQPESGM